MREKWSDHYQSECVSNDFSGKWRVDPSLRRAWASKTRDGEKRGSYQCAANAADDDFYPPPPLAPKKHLSHRLIIAPL